VPAEPLVRMAGGLRRAALAALDLLLPASCLTCDAPVGEPGQLCTACFQATEFVTEPLCRCCGVPFVHAAQGGPDRLCPGCRAGPPPFQRARAALRYDAQARRILLPFKYADRTEIAAALARHMARAGAALLREADLLVPVPLHRRRLRARRYNQAALLARALAAQTGVPAMQDALRRVRHTVPLGERGAEERARILQGAVVVRAERAARLRGRRVLLVDDVMTSGATAAACAGVLREAGAAAVDVLVAARVPDPRLA